LLCGGRRRSRCVSDVRRALADQNQQVIKTVPRRGYLFDKAVSSGSEAELALVAQQALAPLADALEASTDAGRGDTCSKAPGEGAAPGTPASRAGVPAFLGKRSH
jgi:hypothetical protein